MSVVPRVVFYLECLCGGCLRGVAGVPADANVATGRVALADVRGGGDCVISRGDVILSCCLFSACSCPCDDEEDVLVFFVCVVCVGVRVICCGRRCPGVMRAGVGVLQAVVACVCFVFGVCAKGCGVLNDVVVVALSL